MQPSRRDPSQTPVDAAARAARRLAIGAAVMVSALALSAGPARSSEAPGRSADDARRTIAAHGFTNVQGLRLDPDDVWRGQAAKHDRRWDVQVDQRGNFQGTPGGAAGDWGSPADRPKATIRLFLVIR